MKIKNKLKLIILSTVISIAGIIFFIMLPVIKNIKKVNAEITELKLSMEQNKKNSQPLKETMKKLKKINVKIASFSHLYIPADGELKLITELEKIAGKNDLEQKISLSNTSGETGQLNLNLIGTYPDLLKYLSDLKILDYYININSIALKKSAKKQPVKPTNEESDKIIKSSIIEASLSANFYINLPE